MNIISTSVREPIDNIGLSNTLRGARARSKSLSRELPACITINNILPGFTDTDRLGSLASSISSKTGKKVEEVQENWINSVPIQRLIDPLETAIAVVWLCLPSVKRCSRSKLCRGRWQNAFHMRDNMEFDIFSFHFPDPG